jgi:hypothetical protein
MTPEAEVARILVLDAGPALQHDGVDVISTGASAKRSG